MNRLLYLVLVSVVAFLTACGTSGKFQASFQEDKPLYSAINQLLKKPDNDKARADIQWLYRQAVQRHEDAANAYRGSGDLRKWDRILAELNALQHLYTSISSVPEAAKLLTPKNYLTEIEEIKSMAAEDYYQRANALLSENNRNASIQAYEWLKKTENYNKGYKNSQQLIREAYERSVLNVVVNPINEDQIFFSSYNSWNTGFQFRPEEFQESLVRELDLGGKSDFTQFYTSRQARSKNLQADRVVDIRWSNIDAYNGVPHQYTRQVSKNVQVGTDTAGKAVMRTVYATLKITQRVFSVRGNIDYIIHDLENGGYANRGTVMDDVSWTDSYASYSGDARALDDNDRFLINQSRQFNNPSKGDVLNALMRKMYPELKRRIQMAVL